MITSRKSRKTGNTILMFDFQPEKTVYQAVIELTIDGKSKIIPFKCTGYNGQRFMKDIELERPASSVTISYIVTTTLSGKTEKFKDSETNLKVISETDDSITLFPKREKGVKAQYFKRLKNTPRKPKISSEEEDRLVKEYEQIMLNNPQLMETIGFLAQGSSENEEGISGDVSDSDDLDVLNLARQIDDNASDSEITEKLSDLIFNEKTEEDKINEFREKIEELATNCITDTPNIEKHFEKFKWFFFKNTSVFSKMSSDDRDYIRKLIRSIKSLMKVCKKSSVKKTRSEALHEFCAKTELDDNTQEIANIVERVSRINSETSLMNSEKIQNNSETSLKNSESSLKNSEKIQNNSETSLKNSEKIQNNSETFLKNSEKIQNNSETCLKNSEEDSENKKDLTEMILNYFFT